MTGDYRSPPNAIRAAVDDRQKVCRPNPSRRAAAMPMVTDDLDRRRHYALTPGHVKRPTRSPFGRNIQLSEPKKQRHSTWNNDFRRIGDFDVARKLAHRGRGLDQLEKRVGPVCRHIELRLAAKRRQIRVLEIGCGYGVTLMQLRHQFGTRVHLVGTNRETAHGDIEAMITAALMRKIYAAAEIQSVTLPTIDYCDVSNGLPFDDCTFDLVVSQMCIQFIPDKILLLREAARVLAADGIAMIHTALHDPNLPGPYGSLLEVWDQGVALRFSDYLARWQGVIAKQLGHHSCVHLSHRGDFGADLELLHTIRLNDIFPTGDGIKSIYRRTH